jgi:phosphatidylglycerol:prolipoprotein diacylglycerol transferase
VRQILLRVPIPGTDLVLTLYGYGAMMCLGFLAAILTAAHLAKRQKQSPDVVYNIALLCFFGGIFGARLFYVVQYSGQFPRLWDLVRIWEGGLTFYGGFLLAVAAVVAYLKITRRPVLYWLDIVAPGVALGEGLGRVGCFLNGCCYGDVCRTGLGFAWPVGTIPWYHYAEQLLGSAAWFDPARSPASLGMTPAQPAGAAAGALMGSLAAAWHAPVIYPAQLLSLANAVLLAVVLYTMWRWKRRHGQVLMTLMLLYGISRFLLEALRADETPAYLLGLPTLLETLGFAQAAARLPGMTISQNVAVGLVLASLVGLLWLARSRSPRLQADYVPPAEPTEDSPQARRKKRRER